MSKRFFRFCAAALLAITGTAMLVVTFDAEARRMGGGGSYGRQSTNVMNQRQATPPAAPSAGATTAQRSAAAPAAAAGTAAAAGAATRSTASRWFGPIAGIAAGLGLAALLSHMGLGAAFAEFMASLLLIGLVVFAVLFLIRRLRGGAARPAMQGAGQGGAFDRGGQSQQPIWRESLKPAAPAAAAPAAAAAAATPSAAAAESDQNWFIPGNFDTPQFLAKAKEHFVQIQKLWDSGDTQALGEYLTEDLVAELRPQLAQRSGTSHTDVVLLNAELLGIEKVSDGHLASVRFSGMLREDPQAEAFRFEEVWNLFKPDNGGWLLAGIQQIPVEYAS
ncbi:Tim44-like domain-containing protein [Orrella sp. JC864]|uniref:Tim44 domain-containing protein n=1 Tax=Orrella sp. JC864 TaxID=3120298 RepID=UPI00300AB079